MNVKFAGKSNMVFARVEKVKNILADKNGEMGLSSLDLSDLKSRFAIY